MEEPRVPTLLSVNNYYYRRGGADIVFLEENALFEELGWSAVPFAMQHPRNEASQWSDYFVDEIEFGHDYSLPQKVKMAAKVIYSTEARAKLGKLLDQVRPDVAHVHNIYHHISPSILGVLNARGIPTVLTTHDLKVACPAYSMLTHDGVCERCKNGGLYNVALHRCIKGSRVISSVVMLESYVHYFMRSYQRYVDVLVTPSQFYRSKLAEWGWDSSKIVHVPNYVDVEQFDARSTVGDYFVFFGRLSREKGLATLIDAAASANVPLRIVGTGPDNDVLNALANELGADVQFRGYRSSGALHDEIRNARAVVLPSEWYENGPLSVLESYALSTPVIGSAIGGIPEFIRDGETGATFETGSTQDLAGQLRKFADMPDDDILAMGRAGRAWVESDFTPLRYRERLIDVFRDIGVAV